MAATAHHHPLWLSWHSATFGHPFVGPWGLLMAGALTVSGLLVALFLGVLYHQTVETAGQLMQTYAVVVAEETTRKLQTIDQRLELTALKLSRLDAASTHHGPEVNTMLQTQIQDIPYLNALWWVNTQGTVQYDSDPLNTFSDEGLPGGDVDYLALFTAQPHLDFYMGVPARGGRLNTWQIQPISGS